MRRVIICHGGKHYTPLCSPRDGTSRPHVKNTRFKQMVSFTYKPSTISPPTTTELIRGLSNGVPTVSVCRTGHSSVPRYTVANAGAETFNCHFRALGARRRSKGSPCLGSGRKISRLALRGSPKPTRPHGGAGKSKIHDCFMFLEAVNRSRLDLATRELS